MQQLDRLLGWDVHAEKAGPVNCEELACNVHTFLQPTVVTAGGWSTAREADVRLWGSFHCRFAHACWASVDLDESSRAVQPLLTRTIIGAVVGSVTFT